MKSHAGWKVLSISTAAWMGAAWLSYGHDFKQLRIVVNQLDSATTPELQQREKEMNDILRQCQKHGIYLQVTIEAMKTNQNPTHPDGTPVAPDGKVPNTQAGRALKRIALGGEVKTNGVKLWVGKEVRFGTNSITASNRVVNGVASVGAPNAVISEQSGVNGDAHTWTHELGHTLGLEHVSGDTNNLMSPARSVGGAATGNGLTADQCKALQKGADLRSPKTGKTKEQMNQPAAKTVSFALVDPLETGPWSNTPYDLDWAQLVVDYFLLNPTNPALYVATFVNGGFDPPPLAARYLVWVDRDNDPRTGDAAGFDAMIIQQLISPTEGLATLRFLPSGMSHPLPAIVANSVSVLGTGETNGWGEADGAVLHCWVPLAELGPLGNMIRVQVTSANESLEEVDSIGPEAMIRIPPPEPALRLNVIETLPGNMVMVQGTMFTPDTPYRITFDSTIMAEGMTTPAGEINASFVAPDLLPGDYLVDAIDASCRVQIAVLRMLDNQGLKIRVEGGQVAISFRTHPGPTYVVEYKEDLTAGPWMELQRISTTEPSVTVYDMPPPERPRFYRWRQE